MNTYERVHRVWSDETSKRLAFDLWDAHLAWLHTCGFDRAFDQPGHGMEELPPPSGHEVVDLLAEYIFTRGYVNAHLGLTSSDIVDNVRLIQLNQSLTLLTDALLETGRKYKAALSSADDTVGFTHQRPAAPISWAHRCEAWWSPIEWLCNTRPPIFAKKFGGPVGDGRSLERVTNTRKRQDNPFDWALFQIHDPINRTPLQSSDHLCETRAVMWISAVAAQLHKIASDLRFLHSRDLIMILRPPHHAGSSSMPHKTNPYRWEKVCSICRSIANTPREMWDVMAHNSLERSLDTSWLIKSCLKRSCEQLGLVILAMQTVDCRINHSESRRQLEWYLPEISSDHDLTTRVLDGSNRWSAYQSMLAQQNQKP